VRDYGKLQTSFWTSDDIRCLSDDGKMLAAYLLTSSHTTLIGCFRLPDGYVSEDLGWTNERVSEAFRNLSDNGFITRDPSSKWLLIHKFLRWNDIENPNQGKSAVKLFSQVPDGELKTALARALFDYAKHFPDEALDGYLTVTQTVSKPETGTEAGTVSETGTEIIPAKPSTSRKKKAELSYDDYPEFLEFWSAYPNKEGKYKALEAWAEKNPPIDRVLDAIAWQVHTDKWRKDNGQYIPLPTTYINGKRWEDERPQEVAF
jgi:hypothetical protein